MYLLREHAWIKNGRTIVNPICVSESHVRLMEKATHVIPDELGIDLTWNADGIDGRTCYSSTYMVNGSEFYFTITEIMVV